MVQNYQIARARITAALPATIASLAGLQLPAKMTWQGFFTEMLMKVRFDAFVARQQNPHYVTWINSLDDEYAGRWLEVLPKTPKLTFFRQPFATDYMIGNQWWQLELGVIVRGIQI
jgi:hypothetical protein